MRSEEEINRTISEPTAFYLCYRPDTKSKASHAACRQYIFGTTPELMKWLRSRRNSTERIVIEVVSQRKLERTIVGLRCDLCLREGWPL